MTVAVVTDSAAMLPPEVVAAHGIAVVPLQVVVDGRSYDEGVDERATPAFVAKALRDHLPVSTSRATPAAMLDAYLRAAAAGAEEIVSVHLSAALSATYESAQLAATQLAATGSPVTVTLVDTRQVGLAAGYAALAAARRAASGGTARQVASAARQSALGSTTLFCVDSLEHLRRGGRISAPSAMLGTVLAVKPLLRVTDGRVESFEKVRTSARALARLADLVVEAAGSRPVRVGVMHLEAAGNAAALADALRERLGKLVVDSFDAGIGGERVVPVVEAGAAIGAHTGPGLVGVAVVTA